MPEASTKVQSDSRHLYHRILTGGKGGLTRELPSRYPCHLYVDQLSSVFPVLIIFPLPKCSIARDNAQLGPAAAYNNRFLNPKTSFYLDKLKTVRFAFT